MLGERVKNILKQSQKTQTNLKIWKNKPFLPHKEGSDFRD